MAGYSGKSLVQKLGIKAGDRLAALNPPSNYWDLLGPLPEDVSSADPLAGPADVVHLFTTEAATLECALASLRERIAPKGMIWVSWPKKASKIPTDLDENRIRGIALRARLVDVKVCAVDETWSGLKLVIRVRDR